MSEIIFSFYDDRIDKHMPDHNDDSQEPDFTQKTFAMRLDRFKDKTNFIFQVYWQLNLMLFH